MPHVGIFVLHYEHADRTNQCLEHLVVQRDDVWATIHVIDNGSTRAYGAPSLRLMHNVTISYLGKNYPMIEAFNRVMRRFRHDIYLCVTNDTKAAPGMLAKLVEALQDPTVGIVAPGTNDRGQGILYVGDNAQPDLPSFDTEHVDNTLWGWRHDVTERIGWPDCEGHTHQACWWVNRDYCRRARAAGYRVVAVRGAFNWHAHTGGLDQVANQAGMDWYQAKWGDLR